MSKESIAIGTIGVRTKEVSENGGTSNVTSPLKYNSSYLLNLI